MEQPSITVTDHPDPADRDAILRPLVAYNDSKVGSAALNAFSIFLRDSKSDAIIGGLWGRSAYNWFVIELLFVPELLRGTGIGSTLIRTAEKQALERECVGVWLDTFSFQALGFYEKLGYEIFGRLDDYPRGESRF